MMRPPQTTVPLLAFPFFSNLVEIHSTELVDGCGTEMVLFLEIRTHTHRHLCEFAGLELLIMKWGPGSQL